MFGLTTTRRLRAELAAAKAETDRQRKRAEQAKDRAATADFNREQLLRQNASLDNANNGLRDRNRELSRRISRLTEADPDYAEALEKQVANLQEQLAAEKRRAERIQGRLNDALDQDLNVYDAEYAGRNWQANRQDKQPGVSL